MFTLFLNINSFNTIQKLITVYNIIQNFNKGSFQGLISAILCSRFLLSKYTRSNNKERENLMENKRIMFLFYVFFPAKVWRRQCSVKYPRHWQLEKLMGSKSSVVCFLLEMLEVLVYHDICSVITNHFVADIQVFFKKNSQRQGKPSQMYRSEGSE